ncbi:Tetratricopeptide repeat protein (modular protein) [anaerobic digester metagenome]|uniref:Tetratricopeptide repeat protein (Modular protein) n=1 Tax=anaerobic digester metagenome TaxID=1263854 RepID=A0A485M2A5_9ZZZZ
MGQSMRRACFLVLIIILLAGCASTFQQKRELSKPMVAIAMGKIQQNDIQGALVELNRAAQANPKDPEVYYAYALVYWRTERFDRALDNATMAVNLAGKLGLEHPGFKGEAYNLKGTILVSMDRPEEAVEAFKKALKDELYLTPEYAHYNLASVYYQQGRYPEAEQSAKKALEENSHYAPAWNILGQVFLKQGQDKHAIEAFEKAILEFPQYTEAHWELAQAFFKTGDTGSAARHLREVIRLDETGLLGARARQSLQNLGEPE